MNRWIVSDDSTFYLGTPKEYWKREGMRLETGLAKIGYKPVKTPFTRFLMWLRPSHRCFRRQG